MNTFVNPIPDLTITKAVSFDFPLGIRTKASQPNCKMGHEPPAHEQIYGQIGTPLRHQGYPAVKENPREAGEGDPLSQDLILDRDNGAEFDHTGRLSGSLVKLLESPKVSSRVKMNIVPSLGGSPIQIYDEQKSLVTGPEEANVWYKGTGDESNNLIFTAQMMLSKNDWDAKGIPNGTYKLVINWAFYLDGDRLPISGFDEAVTFELCEGSSKP